jgi:hypothetical protein
VNSNRRLVRVWKGEQMNLLVAYFDPSAGSLLIQAIVGGFGGIVVVGRYLWIQLRGNRSDRADMT